MIFLPVIGVWLIWIGASVIAEPIYKCPDHVYSVFMADSDDPCIYWECHVGINHPRYCARSLGTLRGFVGRSNPCIVKNDQCIGQPGERSGGANYNAPYYPPYNKYEAKPVPTTTTTTTIPPETVPPTSGVVSYIEYPNYHLRGGERTGDSNVDDCFNNCKQEITCWGVDWDSGRRACYRHKAETECAELIMKTGCWHRRYVECPTESPTSESTATETTTSASTTGNDTATPMTVVVTTFNGQHIIGGQKLNRTNDVNACVQLCLDDDECVGVDYDDTDRGCYGHTISTACGPMEAKPTCNHYRVRDCPTTAVPPTTPSTPPTTTTVPPTIPNALEVFTGQCPIGEITVNNITSLADCLVACAAYDGCAGVNFYASTPASSCRIVNLESSCIETLPANAACDHYRLSICSNLAPTAVSPPLFDSDICVTPYTHILGGTLEASADDFYECMAYCRARGEPDCSSIDWNFVTNRCFIHSQAVTCDFTQLTENVNAMHVQTGFATCNGAEVGTAPNTIALCLHGLDTLFSFLLEQTNLIAINNASDNPEAITNLVNQIRIALQDPIIQAQLRDPLILEIYQRAYAANAEELFTNAGVAGTQLILDSLNNYITSNQ